MARSIANSARIFRWVNEEPSDTYIKQEFTRGFEDDSVILPTDFKSLCCPHCFQVPRYPLVLKCGHVSWYRCFPVWFKRSLKCNYCRDEPVKIEDVMTLHDDRLKRPGSLTTKMYDNAKITCTNIGCTIELKIDQINHHEFLQCPFRLIKCPANRCNY